MPSKPVFANEGTSAPGGGGYNAEWAAIAAEQEQKKAVKDQWAADRAGYRNTLADSGFAQDYRNSLDQLSQARLREGVGATQRGMAAQAVGRGANPAAQRAAIMQGGQMGLQATNQAAQFAQQADMAGAQMAQAEWARRLQSMEHQEQMRQQALATQAGRYSTNVQANQNAAGGPGFGDILGGLGQAAVGIGMMSSSDVRAKEGITPMSGTPQRFPGGTGGGASGAMMAMSDVQNKQGVVPLGGGYEAGASVGAMYQPAGQAVQPSIQDQLAQAQMDDIRRRNEMQAQQQADASRQNSIGGLGQMLSGVGQMFSSDRHNKSLLMALADDNERLRSTLAETVRPEMGSTSPETLDALNRQGNPLDDAMRSLPPYAYRYKDGPAAAMGQPTNPRAGIMAQDAEQHPLTAAMVRETPMGKAIDMPTAMGTNLAMTTRLAERVDELEADRQAETIFGQLNDSNVSRSLRGEEPRPRSLRALAGGRRPRSLRDLVDDPEVMDLPPDVVPAYSDVVYGGQTNVRGTPIGPSIRLRTVDATPEQIARQQARDARAVRWNDPAEGY